MRDNFKFYLKVSLLVCVGILFVWVLYLAREVLWPFVLAVLLVYLLNPLVDYLSNKKLPRVAATVCVYIILLSIFTLIVILIVPSVLNTVQDISTKLPQYINTIKKYTSFLRERYEKIGIPLEWEQLIEQIFQTLSGLTRQAVGSLGKMFSGVFLFVLSLIVSFYLLKDAKKIRYALMNYIPEVYRAEVYEFLKEVDKILGGYIRGQAMVAIMVGTCIGTGLFLLGIRYAFVLGVMAGVFNIVPYLGPIISIIPAFLLALIKEPFSPWIFLWIILLFLGVNQVEAYFLAPYILSKEVKLHPVAVIFAIVVGGAAMGLLGILLAIPVLAIVKAFFIRLSQIKK